MKTRTKLTRSCAGWIVLMLMRGAVAAALPSNAAVAGQAHQLLAKTIGTDGPGASILVARGDEVIFRAARGMAQIELGLPLKADQVFRIGSNTKQFTAAAILKLVEQGRVSLTDPLSRHLPTYPNGAHITVHELLNHTSGIKDYTEIEGYFRTAIREDVSTDKLIAVFKDLPVDFAPGTDFKYCSSGYVLLGAILEKTTGKSWHEAIRDLLTAPLALTHTGFGGDQALIAGRVAGYSTDEHDRTINAPYISMSQAGAAGGLVSTVDDLFHWMRALHGGKVLDTGGYQRLITPVPTSSGQPVDYAYGLARRRVRGEAAIEHSGRDPGFMSETLYVPGPAISVIVLINTDSPRFDITVLASRLAACALGRAYPNRQEVQLTTAQRTALAGVYKRGESGRRIVTARDDGLYTRRDGGTDHRLRAASADELYFDEVLDYFSVSRDAAGNVTALEEFPDGEAPGMREPRLSEAATSPGSVR